MSGNSLLFADLEVRRTRAAARRAIAHLEMVTRLAPIEGLRPLRTFAHRSAGEAVRTFRTALNRRAFEIRQLS